MGIISGLWNFTKKVVKASGVAAAVGFGYGIGAAGTTAIDAFYYVSRGILTVDLRTFPEYLVSNTLATLRHANDVGGMLATAAGVGSTIALYKLGRR